MRLIRNAEIRWTIADLSDLVVSFKRLTIMVGLAIGWEVMLVIAEKCGSHRPGDLVAADRTLHYSSVGGGIHPYSSPNSVPITKDTPMIVLGMSAQQKSTDFIFKSESRVYWVLTPWGTAWVDRDVYLQFFRVVKRMPV